MPFHEFGCPEHGVVTIKLPITEATGDFRPCPKCGKKAKHIFPVLHRMLLDRKTMRKHTYPKEHGLDGPERKGPKTKWSIMPSE